MNRMYSPLNVSLRRREMLARSAAGFGGLALSWMMQRDAQADDGYVNPLAPKTPVHPAKAKACIFLFMSGGPSQVDLFDPKPALAQLHGQRLPKSFGNVETQFIRETDVLMASPRKFRKYGESGIEVSDFLPHTAQVVDELALVRSFHCDSFIHESAQYQLSSGRVVSGFPSVGSWVTYGLGTEADNLPSYVVLLDKQGANEGGKPCWSSGFLPVNFQGTVFRNGSTPILDLAPPSGRDGKNYRRTIDAIRELNQATLTRRDSELEARIASYELAFQMQTAAAEAVDLSQETQQTHDMYGVGNEQTDDFGKRCLLARRLVERGVRFVLVFGGGGDTTLHQWDAHNNIEENHGHMCGLTDQPTAALVRDLKQRGLLDETLVVWGGEFGRTPLAEGKGGGKGRDHNPLGYSMWLAGGGLKRGVIAGATDDIGLRPVESPYHIHALHATILHQMGINYEHQEVLHNGRYERLTDVGGKLIAEIV